MDPVQFAKSARFATEMMATCKEHLVAIRLNPQIAKESRKICAVVRLCYAYAEDSAMKGEPFNQAIFNCILRLVRGMETTMPGAVERGNAEGPGQMNRAVYREEGARAAQCTDEADLTIVQRDSEAENESPNRALMNLRMAE
ncbi:uncharacterized protein LOC115318920 [Ixodes scapularis]|uniref:uncharacterized protein LOC115318920 n=1 Tax=Ixodes scapularis TaxID=6945 RepID=UPI001C38E669|nr:uncharacterized protein LOC115318920 [Ixodes scapularis]